MDEQKRSENCADGDQDASMGDQTGSSRKENKGKAKEPSMFDRLRSSAKMASEAITSSNGDLQGVSPSSAKMGATGPNVSQESAGILETTPLNRPSQSAKREMGSFREHHASGSSSQAFDDFISGQEPKLPQEPARMAAYERTVRDTEAADGSAVVDLLSQPPRLEDMPAPEDQDERLTPAAAEKLREALFGPSGIKIPWDHLLNFTPWSVARPGHESEEARAQLGTSDPTAARDIWLSQWQDVLSAYTDEVWGDLGQLAAEARNEVEDLVSQYPVDGNTKEEAAGALGRLRMILAHVRGSV